MRIALPALLVLLTVPAVAAPLRTAAAGKTQPKQVIQKAPQEPEWRLKLAEAKTLIAAGQLPQARLALRQACAAALEAKTWSGVVEAITMLAGIKQAVPAYFPDYLRKAEDLARVVGEAEAILPIARAWLLLERPDEATRLLTAAYATALDRGRFGDAVLAAEALFAAGRTEDAMAHLVRIARLALDARQPGSCLAAAEAMFRLGIPGAGRRWANQAAQAFLRAKTWTEMLKAIELLEKHGFKDDAQYWDAMVH